MPTSQIPAEIPTPSGSRPDAGDLYDPRHWESAYLELHDVPALLIQLQDDLSRSRMREAFWLSVIVHLFLVILIVNSDRFAGWMPHRAVLMVSPDDMIRQKDLTYLEQPPDEQKVPKPPDTNKVSDKNRIATSKKPQLNQEDLKKILDSARAGTPGRNAPPAPQPPQQQQAPPQQAQETAPQQPQPPAPPKPTPNPDQIAKLTVPQDNSPKPSFRTPSLSAGSAIEQAARAAAANRAAGGYGGDVGEGGDYGLGQGRQSQKLGPLEVLNDTMGVDFGPYLARVLHDVRQNWYTLIPEVARQPIMKKGKVSIEFAIMKDGKVQGLRIVSSSDDVALDRAAYGGITGSNPFPPLPQEFAGSYLQLRFHFLYNPDKADLQ